MAYYGELRQMIEDDQYLMQLLKTIGELGLEDCWLCAGVIRNFVWDELTERNTPTNDIDVIYFDEEDLSTKSEELYEKKLEEIFPKQPWSVRNQARMHLKSGFSPYHSAIDGVAHFPETPTAVAARLNNGKVEVVAPYGLKDLFNMVVKPTRFYEEGTTYRSIYLERIQKKKWENNWHELSIY